jgi:hypothetical protein
MYLLKDPLAKHLEKKQKEKKRKDSQIEKPSKKTQTIAYIAKWVHAQRGVKSCPKMENSTLWNFVQGDIMISIFFADCCKRGGN